MCWSKLRFSANLRVLARDRVKTRKAIEKDSLPLRVAAFAVADPRVVAQMTADVAEGPIFLRPFPTAHRAWLPVLDRGDTSELSVAEILEEGSEVFIDLFSRVPSILESRL